MEACTVLIAQIAIKSHKSQKVGYPLLKGLTGKRRTNISEK
jgi:hypothetical protein